MKEKEDSGSRSTEISGPADYASAKVGLRPLAKPSVQKVGAVLKAAGFERSRWLKSGRIKGWGRATEGYRVKLHWNGYIEVTWRESDWARGSDEEREAAHEVALGKLVEVLSLAGLPVVRRTPHMGRAELRVGESDSVATFAEPRDGTSGTGAAGQESTSSISLPEPPK